jgi:hypothetical protein
LPNSLYRGTSKPWPVVRSRIAARVSPLAPFACEDQLMRRGAGRE